MSAKTVAVLLAWCLVSVVGFSRGVAAEPPAAMVMSVKGPTTPPIAAMSEIPSGEQIQLGSDTELTLLHYGRCKMITVTGGSVSATRTDVLADGKISAQVDAPCPRIHKLGSGATGAVSGGLVMRGIAAAPRWPLNRELLITGSGSDKLQGAAIYADGKPDAPLVQLQVKGHQASYPGGGTALPEGAPYVLRLTLKDSAEPLDIPFIGAPSSGTSLVVVLRGP